MNCYTGSITYGREDILFNVLFVKRKTMEIAVFPDSRVVVKVPFGTSTDDIKSRMKKRARWLTKQLSYFRQFDPRTPSRCYVGGETHLYLGRQYRLKLIATDVANVKLMKGYFWICSHDITNPENIKELLENWYREKAEIKFDKSFQRCWKAFERFGVEKPNMQIRLMKTRWGSLSKKGSLTLNLDLIRAPRDCIDYVITHELCHLRHHNHGSDFYKLLERVMPDWEKLKHRLEISLV